ncbi:MAG: NTP transferase domain-containing protein [Anaerolineae bacterium]|nr:NTP transferase domain-containing protein [Anaerolineae bacterium]
MKVVLPMAGLGTRLRPHTWSKPKPLIEIAGKPVLAHVLDYVLPLGIDEVICIVGWLGDQIRDYIDAHYEVPARYVWQEELKGQAHAVYLAREHLQGPCLFTWVDTLFRADLSGLSQVDADAVAFVKEAEDPRPFGVAVVESGRVVRLIEKPKGFEHRQVVVGVYYVAEGAKLARAVESLLSQGIQTEGEFYLADAFNVMLGWGARMITRSVSVWEDCGVPDTLLKSNRFLLANGHHREAPTRNSVLVPPVYIAETAEIENAVIGPYVSVGEGAQVRGAIIQDAIVGRNACIEHVVLEHSLIGDSARVIGAVGSLNIGDDSASMPL